MLDLRRLKYNNRINITNTNKIAKMYKPWISWTTENINTVRKHSSRERIDCTLKLSSNLNNKSGNKLKKKIFRHHYLFIGCSASGDQNNMKNSQTKNWYKYYRDEDHEPNPESKHKNHKPILFCSGTYATATGVSYILFLLFNTSKMHQIKIVIICSVRNMRKKKKCL